MGDAHLYVGAGRSVVQTLVHSGIVTGVIANLTTGAGNA